MEEKEVLVTDNVTEKKKMNPKNPYRKFNTQKKKIEELKDKVSYIEREKIVKIEEDITKDRTF